MSYILDRYRSYTSTSSREDLEVTLQLTVEEPPHTFDNQIRPAYIQVLIDDLVQCTNGDQSAKLTRSDAPLALLAVKTLGKIPQGADTIGRPQNLKALLNITEEFADTPDARNEAWRCIANTLLLIESSRQTLVSKEVGGGETTVKALQNTHDPELIFLLSRTLFLSTVSASSASAFIRSLVEDTHGENGTIVDIIALRLDGLMSSVLTGQRMSREATSELLKVVFNLLVHYPKVADKIVSPNANETTDDSSNAWDERLNGILPSLLRMFNTLPPTTSSPLSSPLTHVIHALITIPVTPTLRTLWFSTSPTGGNSPVATTGPSASGSERSGTPPAKQSTLDRALSVLGRRSLQGRGSPSPAPPTSDTLQRAYDLLEVSLAHFLPGDVDPDDESVRRRVKQEADSTLDELAAPLVILLTRLCVADEGCRKRVSDWLFPADLDRTGAPLESRADLLGRCLRLLSSVYAVRMKDVVGEMLYVICNSDAGLLVAQVGYGNVAGFLYGKGVMAAPPRSDAVPSTTSGGQSINPITGVAYRESNAPEMTDEEKEREAEKLFVLFDRLEKNGAIQPSQNPVRKAMQEQQRREG